MSQFKVAKGRSIMLPTQGARRDIPTAVGDLLKEGSPVPEGMFTKEELDSHIQSGFIVPANGGIVNADGSPVIPDTVVTVPTKEIDADDAPNITDAQRQAPAIETSPGPVASVTAQPLKTENEQVVSPWTLDPASLEGMGLVDLQVRIMELHADENFDVESEVTTVEDAVKFLSQDFVPAKE